MPTAKELAELVVHLEKAVENTEPEIMKVYGKALRELQTAVHNLQDADDAGFKKATSAFAVLAQNIQIERANLADPGAFDVPATMNVSDFKKRLLKIPGVTAKGKDGKNHDIMAKGGKTTSLGLDQHDTKTSAKNMRIYLKQLGVSRAEWEHSA